MASHPLRRIRIALWGLVGCAVLALGIYAIMPRPDVPTGPAGVIVAATDEPYGTGDYQLVTDEGEAADSTIFIGQPSAVFFGFTHCPDVCPTTLGEMSLWFSELGDEAGDLRGFFVTVDPERDTPEILNAYVGWASDRITGLTGTPEDIADMADAWGIHAERTALEGGGYNVDHTASVFLLDANGQFRGTISYGEATATALEKLRLLVRG